MGCYVNIASGQTRAKSKSVIAASILNVVTGVVFIVSSFFAIDALPLLMGVGVIEFIIARWVWSLRIESWGIAVGFSIFHLIYPLVLSFSYSGFLLIAILSIAKLVFLAQTRLDGFYSFVHMSKIDPMESFEPSMVQTSVFNLIFIAQLGKAILLFFGLMMLYSYESVEGALYWYGVPLFLLLLIMGILDLIAAIGFIIGQDWAFQLVLVMAGLGLAETIFSGGLPIILIAIWIITLLLPCWAKWAFYSKILHRTKTQNSDSMVVEIPTLPE